MAPPVPSSSTAAAPTITTDPRFRAGRKLVGTSDGVEMFGLLLAALREQYDAAHIETIPGYYEYGNALLRYAMRRSDDSDDHDTAVPAADRRAAAAAAAERRAQQLPATTTTTEEDDSKKRAAVSSSERNNSKLEGKEDPIDEKKGTTSEDNEDLSLALEMMETAWSILDEHLNNTTATNNASDVGGTQQYREWMIEQRPRILTGLGDVLLELQRPADATDAYLQALQHRQDAVPTTSIATATTSMDETEPLPPNALEILQSRRRVVEATILVTESLLACRRLHPTEAVVTTETQTILVPERQVVSYVTGYYDKARDALQDVLYLLRRLAGAKVKGVDEEKEDVCCVATMVMGVGEALTLIEEEEKEKEEEEPAKKKSKR